MLASTSVKLSSGYTRGYGVGGISRLPTSSSIDKLVFTVVGIILLPCLKSYREIFIRALSRLLAGILFAAALAASGLTSIIKMMDFLVILEI